MGNAASMVNQISCSSKLINSAQELTSDTVIEVLTITHSLTIRFFFDMITCGMQVTIEIPFAFRLIPVQAIESTGRQVLEQILKVMLPRFMEQVSRASRLQGVFCYYFFTVI